MRVAIQLIRPTVAGCMREPLAEARHRVRGRAGAVLVAALACASFAAAAQPSSAGPSAAGGTTAPAAARAPGSDAGAPAVQHSPGGIDYLSGGAGEEERAAMAARGRDLPLKLVLSGAGGEYLVAERVSVRTAQGELLTVRDAGPVVMMKLPPGSYTVEVAVQGRVERRNVQGGASAQTINWRFPG